MGRKDNSKIERELETREKLKKREKNEGGIDAGGGRVRDTRSCPRSTRATIFQRSTINVPAK